VGYDAHITRKDDWSDEAGPVITLQEWLAVIDADPDLRLDGHAETTAPDGSVLRLESPGMAVWTAHPDGRRPGDLAWIGFAGDHIQVKTPDPAFLAKMIEIADILGAAVQGDDSERYDADSPAARPRSKKRRFRR
jgi:hypothetical protein